MNPTTCHQVNRLKRLTWDAGGICEQKWLCPDQSLPFCKYHPKPQHYLTTSVSRLGITNKSSKDPNIKADLRPFGPSMQRIQYLFKKDMRRCRHLQEEKTAPFVCLSALAERPGNSKSAFGISSESTNSVLHCHIPELSPWLLHSIFKCFLLLDPYQKGISSHQQSDPLCEAPFWQEKPLHLFF